MIVVLIAEPALCDRLLALDERLPRTFIDAGLLFEQLIVDDIEDGMDVGAVDGNRSLTR